MKLPHAALIVLADGQRHLILENRGKAVLWDLQVVSTDQTTVQKTGAQGTERPGRYPIAGGRRTAVEQTDWKALNKAEFSKHLAHWINAEITISPDTPLVLIADAKTLGLLRDGLNSAAQAAVLTEISGNHVHEPIEAIIELLKAA
ncbi:MAG: host attachment family protein [Hyphomicrobiales bacterium]